MVDEDEASNSKSEELIFFARRHCESEKEIQTEVKEGEVENFHVERNRLQGLFKSL